MDLYHMYFVIFSGEEMELTKVVSGLPLLTENKNCDVKVTILSLVKHFPFSHKACAFVPSSHISDFYNL